MLITPPEILKKTVTSDFLDQGKLLPFIETAELRFLSGNDSLGWDFYADLATEKNQLVTSANKAALQQLFDVQHARPHAGKAPVLEEGMMVNAAEFLTTHNRALWDAYLWKYAAECVVYLAEAGNYIQFGSQGLSKANPMTSALGAETSPSAGVTLNDVKYVQEKRMREIIEPLRVRFREYLHASGQSFPVWSRLNRGAPAKMTGYTDLSVYRDEDEGRGGGCVWKGNNPQTPGRSSSPCCDGDPLGW